MEKPFWGDACPVRDCCGEQGHAHCGMCDQFPCRALHGFSYDAAQGDGGTRILQCAAWKKEATPHG